MVSIESNIIAGLARLMRMPKGGRIYYLMDCGSWVNGGHEVGVIAGKDIAICQWGEPSALS